LSYNQKGTQVTLTINHDTSVENEVPHGFSQEHIRDIKAGELAISENDPSNFLCYIVSGKYSVYHKSKKVGFLLPQDIFMGEIAFLLNQPRSASVRADEPGKLISLSRKALIDIIRKHPHYGIFISRLLARRLVRANEQNVELREQLARK
jgi:CRP-like cAMP-binding protein